MVTSLFKLAITAAVVASFGGCVALDNYPQKGDARPHPGVAAAHRYPVHGIDISRWQGEIDWDVFFRALGAAGFDGVMSSCVFAWEDRAEASSRYMRDAIQRYVDRHFDRTAR